jgi:hypothetical protein
MHNWEWTPIEARFLALCDDSDFDVQLWAMALVPRVIHSAINYRVCGQTVIQPRGCLMRTRLLIAHRDIRFLDVCQRFFSNQGFDVDVAADERKCLSILADVPVDVLVLQRELGGGRQPVVNYLRQDLPWTPPPVVLIENRVRGAAETAPPVCACVPVCTTPVSFLNTVQNICYHKPQTCLGQRGRDVRRPGAPSHASATVQFLAACLRLEESIGRKPRSIDAA